MVAMARAGVSLIDVERELDRRALKVSRRNGVAKVLATNSEETKDDYISRSRHSLS